MFPTQPAERSLVSQLRTFVDWSVCSAGRIRFRRPIRSSARAPQSVRRVEDLKLRNRSELANERASLSPVRHIGGPCIACLHSLYVVYHLKVLCRAP